MTAYHSAVHSADHWADTKANQSVVQRDDSWADSKACRRAEPLVDGLVFPRADSMDEPWAAHWEQY